MTILNVACSRQRALIATNTEGVRGLTGESGIVTKTFLFSAVNAALAGTGQMTVLFNVFADLCGLMAHFDEMAEALPSILAKRHAAILAEVADLKVEVPCDMRLVLVGWSKRRREMRAWIYETSPEGVKIQDMIELDICTVMPWSPEWGPVRAASFIPNEMLALARFQSDRCTGPLDACGGDMVLTEIDEKSTLTMVLPMPAKRSAHAQVSEYFP